MSQWLKNVAVSFAFILILHQPLGASVVVNTQYGPIEGQTNGNVIQFLGIPFAKPPVDTLRWRAPLPPESWSATLQTTAFKPACPQKQFGPTDTAGTIKGNEDCLYLNVWTPGTDTLTRPVMVFIHGGGNQQGAAGESANGTSIYFGKNMADRSNVVIVTIQYRLGALGYMVHPGLEAESSNGKAGNYGVLDQVLALQWVKNNIHLFGGDTTNITVFGESAGGVNAGNLLLNPNATGLYHKVIIQSAVPNLTAYTDIKNKSVSLVNSFAQATGTDAQKIAYMRSLPPDSLVKGDESPMAGGLLQLSWGPVMDGQLFTQFPLQALANGNYNKVPVMIGSNGDEMSTSAPPIVTPAMVTALVNARVPLAYRSQVLALYPPGNNNTEARKSYVDILSDGQFNASVRRVARCLSNNQTEPVWNYFFTHAHTLPQLAPFGAYHGIELLYVFNTFENSQIGTGPLFKPADDSVQHNSRLYWTNFARTGNPNGSALVNWPEFVNGQDCYLELKATPIGTQCKLREQKFDLWDAIVNFNSCPPTVTAVENQPVTTLLIAPNPTNDKWHIQNETETVWALYSLNGQLLRKGTGNSIDGSTYDAGIYILQCQNGSGNAVYRLVKY